MITSHQYFSQSIHFRYLGNKTRTYHTYIISISLLDPRIVIRTKFNRIVASWAQIKHNMIHLFGRVLKIYINVSLSFYVTYTRHSTILYSVKVLINFITTYFRILLHDTTQKCPYTRS